MVQGSEFELVLGERMGSRGQFSVNIILSVSSAAVIFFPSPWGFEP